MVGNHKLRVGLLIDYIYSDYSQYMLRGMQKACLDFDAQLFIFPIGELHNVQFSYDYQYASAAALVSSANLDGVIFTSGTQMHYMSKADMLSYIRGFNPLPVVNLSSELKGIPSITVDCYKAYKELLDNLIDEQGCKTFCITGVHGNSLEPKTRTKFIKEILEEKGIPAKNVEIIKSKFDYGSVLDDLKAYYTQKKVFDFDALICLSDEMAYGALDFCKKIGKKVPEDIVVCGFDNLERSKYSSPALTSIDQQILKQGYTAVSLLNKMVLKQDVPALTVLDSTVVFRNSTCRLGRKRAEQLDYAAEYSGIEWYAKRSQLYQITKFYTEMQGDMTLDQLRTRINNDTRSFGITACAIVLYDNPVEMDTPFDYFNLPHKARVFTSFDDVNGFDSGKVKAEDRFDPNNYMLPPDTLKSDAEGLMVISLFHKTLQYGYIVLRRGDVDVSVYDLFTKITSTIISNVYSFALMHNETTKYRAKFDKLDVIARTDELTGLNNRRGLYELGQTTLKFAKAMGQSGMIVYCDMDGLKKINDTYGHETGDKAIVAESIILKGNFRSNDVVARIGGDEFALVCAGMNENAFKRIKEQVDADCVKWSEDNKSPFRLSISMGAIKYPSETDGYEIAPLLSQADSLLYIEKRNKKRR